MHVTKKNLSDTKVQLKMTADEELLATEKQRALNELGKQLKVQGFRQGKAPASMIEKYVDPAKLQSLFLERAVNRLYTSALDHEKLRPVEQAQLTISKFVPFDTLEVEVEVEVIGDIKLADYKNIKLEKTQPSVEDKEIDEVINNLRTRHAEKKDVERQSQDGDQVWIDFKGTDLKTKEPVKGADGQDFPLVLGSNTFIPGFEPNLVGLKPGQEKTFTITFPKDYGLKTLQNREVEFAVTVKKVQEVVKPEVNDDLAKQVGPFKTLQELKDGVRKEMQNMKEDEADRNYTDELILKIVEKSKLTAPEALIKEQLERIEQDQKQNLLYRGQSWEDFLKGEGLDEEGYKKSIRPAAEQKVKAGLVLSEIAEQEGIQLTNQELESQLSSLKSRYTDKAMQAELSKTENKRAIASRLVTDKTVAKLKEYASQK